jgi:hypothetical protein
MMSFVMSPTDCGEAMSYTLFNEEFKKGWYLVNEKGEKEPPHPRHEELRDEVWKYTTEVIDRL